MAEYIEREAVKSAIYEMANSDLLFIDAIIDTIDNAPAADVVEVRHGRWIPFHSKVAGEIQYCSACDIGCTWRPNYCPNCGARMDGE